MLTEVSQMAGGTSPVAPFALPAASPAPPGPPPTSEEMWAGMVYDGGAGGRWQGQRVTPAVTRSRAKRDGLRPRMSALMATQEDIARSIAELSLPDVIEQELPSDWPAIWRRRRRAFRHTPALIAASGRRRRARTQRS